MRENAYKEKLMALVEPICVSRNVELVDVQYVGQPGGSVVRVFIDKPKAGEAGEAGAAGESGEAAASHASESALPTVIGSGVSLEDCTAVSRDLSTALDVHDFLPSAYHLEVSSPGLDRPLVREKDFLRFTGQEIKLQTHEPLGERRRFRGKLLGFREGEVTMEQDGVEVRIPLGNVAKANVVPRF